MASSDHLADVFARRGGGLSKAAVDRALAGPAMTGTSGPLSEWAST
jgi:hypothetical protein